jgi:hypothetical protein
LFLRRRGLRALTLSATLDQARVGRAVRALSPAVLVLSGSGTSLDRLGRLVYASRQAAGHLEVLDFRGALPETGASTVGRLGTSALEASDALVTHLERPPGQDGERSGTRFGRKAG